MSKQGTSWMAPGLAAAMLAALLVLHVFERGTSGNIDQYLARVAEEVDAVPARIGPFLGRETEVAPGAVKLLRPNRILQRRYTNIDSPQQEWFSLLIVHCGVATDMNNHFPPVCYPNSGWKLEGEAEDVVVQVNGMDIPARRYRFQRPDELFAEPMDILSFFVLPSGQVRFGGDMGLVDMSSRYPWTDKLGAGQFQILTPAGMSEEMRGEIWDQVLGAIAPVLYAIAEGPA